MRDLTGRAMDGGGTGPIGHLIGFAFRVCPNWGAPGVTKAKW
jgi:hypothetical protein